MTKGDIEGNPILKKGISIAVEMASKKMNSNFALVPDTVTATSQVVEGISYDVKIEIAPKDKVDECILSSACPNEIYVCTFNVWSREWMPKPKDLIVDKLKCSLKH